jgi:hypothetical protein
MSRWNGILGTSYHGGRGNRNMTNLPAAFVSPSVELTVPTRQNVGFIAGHTNASHHTQSKGRIPGQHPSWGEGQENLQEEGRGHEAPATGGGTRLLAPDWA